MQFFEFCEFCEFERRKEKENLTVEVALENVTSAIAPTHVNRGEKLMAKFVYLFLSFAGLMGGKFSRIFQQLPSLKFSI